MESIAKALVAAQQEMTKATKGSENPHFRSKYADLGNVMDACLPALNKNGIAVIQIQKHVEGEDYVVTQFLHESGQFLETAVRLLIGKADMQGMGSAITYARRYGLMELAGIAPEDDDGNAAANTPADRKQKPAAKEQKPAETGPPKEAEEYRLPDSFVGAGWAKTMGEQSKKNLTALIEWGDENDATLAACARAVMAKKYKGE